MLIPEKGFLVSEPMHMYSRRGVLRKIFDRRELWESREQRKKSFRNGDWFTMGASLYLDLQSPEGFPEYCTRVEYWNDQLDHYFEGTYWVAGDLLKTLFPKYQINSLSSFFSPASKPGFHIFPPNEGLGHFFGKMHKDLQWNTLFKLPHFTEKFNPEKISEHFSFTLPLLSPLGGSQLLIEGEEKFVYQDGCMYVHSGQFNHAIAPFNKPVLPSDWRITYQGHGFIYEREIYIYW